VTESAGLENNHLSANLSTDQGNSQTDCESLSSTSNNVSLSHALLTTGERVLLQTATVTICGSDGH